MFAYCGNNPVMYSDPSGKCSIIAEFIQDVCFALLDAIAGIIPPNRKNLSEEQIAFAAIVYAEAGGTNIKTQKAVAHTINNRVVLGHWTNPQNIIEAISYPDQFTAYNNDKYLAAYEYYTTGKISNELYNNSMEIADMNRCLIAITPIYNGNELDFTGGVLYFHSLDNPGDWRFHEDYELVDIRRTKGFWWYR